VPKPVIKEMALTTMNHWILFEVCNWGVRDKGENRQRKPLYLAKLLNMTNALRSKVEGYGPDFIFENISVNFVDPILAIEVESYQGAIKMSTRRQGEWRRRRTY
jgi:hypothetical protein